VHCGEPPQPAQSPQGLLSEAEDDDVPAARPGCAGGAHKKTRKVVASHPYDNSGNPANAYEVFDLSADGTLSPTGVTFQMGPLAFGPILFTPDGEIGLAAQDDGSIGVFRFERSGAVHVVYPGFTGVSYASGLVIDKKGERVYVLNNQWRDSGGGVYAARIGCDGTLTSEGLVAAAKLPAGMVFVPPSPDESAPRAVVAAVDFLDSAAGDNVHLLRWPHPPKKPTILGGTDGFGDDNAIVSAVAQTPDHRYVLVGDNSEFSGVPNRISVVAVAGTGLRRAQLLTPVPDPVAIVMSPFGNAGLVVSGFGNAIFRLSYDAAAADPLADLGPIPYVGSKPELPANAALLTRGSLRGRVLVGETEGIRQVAFQRDGTIVDLGLYVVGHDLDTVVGGVGVQP
jgi:hypothetical protein